MINESLQTTLNTLTDRFEELGRLLSEPDIMSNQNLFREYSKEYASLEPLSKCHADYQSIQSHIDETDELIKTETDKELTQLAHAELTDLKLSIDQIESQLKTLLIPKDPNDDRNVFLEIRAGTGGDEAAIFVGDLFRMYSRFAENKNWKIELLSQSESPQGGYKEIISRVVGDGAYSKLKFESGAHRVQRVPVTESQGRIHTSACTVAVMPEQDSIDEIDINTNDLRIDTFRSSGAGGQHVNTTDSAVRITHIPTGIVVECQDERSQHKNKARAMSLLSAKILSSEQAAQAADTAATRKSLVGSGDRSERIRTYNYPQGRVSDHRINLTLYKLDDIMEGDLASVIDPLVQELQAQLLAEFE